MLNRPGRHQCVSIVLVSMLGGTHGLSSLGFYVARPAWCVSHLVAALDQYTRVSGLMHRPFVDNVFY